MYLEINVCRHCKALLFQGEESNECCIYGAVQVDPLPVIPEVIQFFCDPANPTPAAKHFREHAIQYKTAVSFGSLSTERHLLPGRGPPVVMSNGQHPSRSATFALDSTITGNVTTPSLGRSIYSATSTRSLVFA